MTWNKLDIVDLVIINPETLKHYKHRNILEYWNILKSEAIV